MRRRLLLSLLPLLLLSAAVVAVAALPQCQYPTESEFDHYHGDETCDRVDQNSPLYHQQLLARNQELHRLPTGIQHVPNEKTVTCPLPSATTSLYPPPAQGSNPNLHLHLGTYTTWIVENTSTLPVVVAFVEFDTGLEVSAFNAHITPPQADPLAILMPHQWKSIRTMEGHVFHVYELLGKADNYQLGRLVLQHRVGLVPIRNQYGSSDAMTMCGGAAAPLVDKPPLLGADNNDASNNNNNDDGDRYVPYEQVGGESTIPSEPAPLRRLTEVPADVVNVNYHMADAQPHRDMAEVQHESMVVPPTSVLSDASSSSSSTTTETDVHPDYQRDPSVKYENCNVLYRGFRNMAGCPVHAYYTGVSPPPLSDGGAMQCDEDFKFHLGINGQASDYENDWDSTTKFETTFIGHTYTFRLASNPEILVDAYTFAPTQVIDCPDSGSAVPQSQHAVAEAVSESVHMPLGDAVTKTTATVPVVVDGVTVGIEGVVLYALPENNNEDASHGDARRTSNLPSSAQNKSWSPPQHGPVYVTAAAAAMSRGTK